MKTMLIRLSLAALLGASMLQVSSGTATAAGPELTGHASGIEIAPQSIAGAAIFDDRAPSPLDRWRL